VAPTRGGGPPPTAPHGRAAAPEAPARTPPAGPTPPAAAALPPLPAWPVPPVPLPPPPRRRRGVLIAAGVVVALVVLVGIPVLLLSVLAKPNNRHASAGSPGRSASPSAAPLSPEEYQRMLDGLFSDVAPSFTTLTGAHKPEDVSSSAGGVHDLLAG